MINNYYSRFTLIGVQEPLSNGQCDLLKVSSLSSTVYNAPS